jgi:hypothetical protein
MLENFVEKEGTLYAEELGWKAEKNVIPGRRGSSDHRYFKNGMVFFIEYKRSGKLPGALQKKRAEEMFEVNVPCFCVDNISDAKNIIKHMNHIIDLVKKHTVKIQKEIDLTVKYGILTFNGYHG